MSLGSSFINFCDFFTFVNEEETANNQMNTANRFPNKIQMSIIRRFLKKGVDNASANK